MWQIINTPETLIFGVALAMMLLLGLVECALWMIGASSDWLNSFLPDSLGELGDVHSPDVAMDLDSAGTFLRFLSWLYLGRLPVLIWLVVFLSVFGTLGYGVQAALYGILGYALPMWLAAIGIWLLSLPVVRTLAAGGVEALRAALEHRLTRSEAQRYMERIARFRLAGWAGLLGPTTAPERAPETGERS